MGSVFCLSPDAVKPHEVPGNSRLLPCEVMAPPDRAAQLAFPLLATMVFFTLSRPTVPSAEMPPPVPPVAVFPAIVELSRVTVA